MKFFATVNAFVIEICKMQLSFNDTRYYVSYIYIVCNIFPFFLFWFICSKWWELNSIGLNMVVISKHRKLRCCGIMEKILFPFFFFNISTIKQKKVAYIFPLQSEFKSKKGKKKGKTLYERLIILIPISIILSLVEEIKKKYEANLKGEIKRIVVIVLVIYSNLFTFLTNFSLFVFICVILFFILFAVYFSSFFFGDFCWRLFYLHLNEGWKFSVFFYFFIYFLYFGFAVFCLVTTTTKAEKKNKLCYLNNGYIYVEIMK